MIDKDNAAGKKVLIIGFGRSGIAAARSMLRLGAFVSIQDSKARDQIDGELLKSFENQGARFYLGCTPDNMGEYDLLIVSPGVSPELDFIREAEAGGAEVIGELELAYRIGRGSYIAITGTNGKTTTTSLVGQIFQRAGRKTSVVGNIGVAVIASAEKASAEDWLVTECSSFQLETTRFFRPEVSAILNLTPDHLNRHHTMEAYGAAKARVFANQTEDNYLVINRDDELCYSLAQNCSARIVPFSREQLLDFGACVKDGMIVILDEEGEVIPICGVSELKIIGKHNLSNALAAAAICYFAGIDPEVIGQGIREFGGVEHRIEFCGEYGGVRYYNDSKGTNTDATETAIDALEQNILLIAGGDAKGQDFDDFVKKFPGHVKQLILLGRDAHFIREACDRIGFGDYVFCDGMEACVRKAAELAVPGDSVLLSPACASWDMYDNYEQRGEVFKACVGRIEG